MARRYGSYYLVVTILLMSLFFAHCPDWFNLQNTYPFLRWKMFNKVEDPSFDYVLQVEKYDDAELTKPCFLHECPFGKFAIQRSRVYWNTQLLVDVRKNLSAEAVLKNLSEGHSLRMKLYKRRTEIRETLESSIGVGFEELELLAW